MTTLSFGKLQLSSEKLFIAHSAIAGMTGCLVGDERVVLATGAVEKIQEMGTDHLQEIKYHVMSGAATNRFPLATTFLKYEHEPVVEIITESGRSLKGTYNHPVLVREYSGTTFDGPKCNEYWKNLGELQIGDPLAIVRGTRCRIPRTTYRKTNWKAPKPYHRTFQVRLPEVVNEDLAGIFGILISDGNIHREDEVSFYLSEDEEDLIPLIRQMVKTLFDAPVAVRKAKTRMFRISINRGIVVKALRTIDGVKEKRIPSVIWKSNNRVAASFVRWFFEGDGHPAVGKPTVELEAKGIELLRDFQLLLLRWRIHSRIYQHGGGHALKIYRRKSILQFAEQIGFVSKKKKERLQLIVKKVRQRPYDVGLKNYERIVAINQRAELETVYDIEVPNGHRFIANGFISHNSGKSRRVSAMLLAQCIEKQPESPEGTKYGFLVIDTQSEYFPFMDEYPKKVIVFSPDVAKGVPFRLSSRNISVDDIAVFLREVTKKEITKPELAAIYLAIDGLRANGDYTLEQVYTKLYEFEAYSLLPAFEKIMATGIFGPEETPFSLLVRPGETSILDIGGLMPEIQAIIVSHLLRHLWNARINKEVSPLVLFLEEASIFLPEEKKAPSSEILYTIATQGRGYNFLLISIFQRSSLTSKTGLSQCQNWFIGKTGNAADRKAILSSVEKIEPEHDKVIRNLKFAEEFLITGFIVENPVTVKLRDPQLLAAKGGRIPPKLIESSFKREDLGNYIETIQGLEAQERTRVQETIKRLRLAREQQLTGVPQKEVEKLKSNLDKEKKRYEEAIDRADKRAKEKYEAKIKEQETEIERLTKLLTLKGQPVADILQHPLVQKRLTDKLTPQQKNLIEFLQRTGPSNPEKIAAYLGCAPKTVPTHVSGINKAIPELVVSKDGLYQSRLRLIFPVTEEAQAEAKEVEQLRAALLERDRELSIVTENNKVRAQQGLEQHARIEDLEKQVVELRQMVARVAKERDILRTTNQHLVEISQGKLVPAERVSHEVSETRETSKTSVPSNRTAELIVKRTLTDVKVAVDHEVLEVDESTWEGKLCARGLDGFFDEAKGIGKIMAELVRRYGVGNSGGNRTTVNDRLTMLVSKGILDRKQETGQWVYSASKEFAQRVRPVQEATA